MAVDNGLPRNSWYETSATCTWRIEDGTSATQKPAETRLALAVLAERAGVPKGVLSVVTGSSRVIGCELTPNPIVRKLSFTEWTPVGSDLMAQCAPTIKKLSLELGGNAPFIMFDDADIDEAVVGAMASKYRNSGQTWACANRFYVHDRVYDEFVSELTTAVGQLKVGHGTADGVTQGPLINEAAVLKVEEHIQDALGKGGRLLIGGKRHALGHGLFEPTVVADAKPSMLLAREETFGPLAPIFRFQTDEEVVALATIPNSGSPPQWVRFKSALTCMRSRLQYCEPSGHEPLRNSRRG